MQSILHVDDEPVLTTVTNTLKDADVPAWLVGGYVRDRLLGRPTNDIDVAIEGDGTIWARRIADRVGGAFVPLDRERGVGRIVIEREGGAHLYVDLAGIRGGDIAADLRLRDFTANAMAIDLETMRLIDPVGGFEDLNRFRIRVVDEAAFRDDPLRLLRAVRLAASLHFYVEPATMALIERHAHRLPDAAPERIRMEFLKLLGTQPAAPHVAVLDELSLLEHIVPELTDCQGVSQPEQHTLDVYGHTLRVLQALEALQPWAAGIANPIGHSFWQPPLGRHRDALASYLQDDIAYGQSRWLLLKLTVLLHDVGKPATRSVEDDGDVHFYKHEHVGADMARARLTALRFPGDSITWITTIIRQHLRPLYLSTNPDVSRRALYRFFRDTDDTAAAVALHSAVDQLGKGQSEVTPALRSVLDRIWTAGFAQEENLTDPTPLLNGHDLQALGIPPGPHMGHILEQLKEQQAMGDVTTRAEAEAFVLQRWQQREP